MQSWLSWFLRGILVLSFLLLLARIFDLQVIKGAYFRELSEENRIKRIPIVATRGKIFARGGEEMVGSEFAHLTGFVGEVGPDEVGKVDPNCPEKGAKKLGQLEGKSGLNAQYNCLLTGIDGETLIEVDTKGDDIRVLGEKKAIPGTNLHTTINYDLQKEVARDLDQKGAVVATDTKGEVLALFSYPTYDPKNIAPQLNNTNLPFFNRAIGGTFHPGSVFKPVVALGALAEGAIDKNYRFTDEGQITVKTLYGDFTYSNWYFTQYGGREGEIDLTRAIARSTDTFFYKLGEMIGPDKIALYANRFGLGEKTGVDLPGEVSGLIPTPDWKKKTKNEDWFLGNTYHYSIGQGDVAVTPIELNRMTATIASKGQLCSPRVSDEKKMDCQSINIDKKNFELVSEGMKEACSSGGTGYTFFDFQPQVGCKTGTAQVGTEEDTHAWFSLFAPFDDPEIVLTVLVEKGGEGSKVAGPIAREIMDRWNLEKNP